MIDSQPSSSKEQVEALLVHYASPGLQFQLPETPLSQTNPLTIGRQAGAHLLIDEGSVSRRHAVISYINKQYMVQDLGSTNGTFVNNERIGLARPCVLQPNDIIRFGSIVTCKFILRSLSPENQTIVAGNPSSAQWSSESNGDFKHIGLGTPVLNPDGSLSSPGIEQPVPASVVATFKEIPALIILPPSSGEAHSTPPWVYLLKPDEPTTIGRKRGNAIELNDPVVSRHHAEFFLATNGYYIRDLGSSNGVIINQTRIAHPHRLSHGDRIKLGKTLIFFVDLQAGHEPTEKRAASPLPTENNEQKLAATYNVTVRTPLMPSQESEINMSYLAALANGVELNSPVSNSVLEESVSRLASSYEETVPGSSTRRITAVVSKVAVAICAHCGTANTHVARFCASCSAPLIP